MKVSMTRRIHHRNPRLPSQNRDGRGMQLQRHARHTKTRCAPHRSKQMQGAAMRSPRISPHLYRIAEGFEERNAQRHEEFLLSLDAKLQRGRTEFSGSTNADSSSKKSPRTYPSEITGQHLRHTPAPPQPRLKIAPQEWSQLHGRVAARRAIAWTRSKHNREPGSKSRSSPPHLMLKHPPLTRLRSPRNHQHDATPPATFRGGTTTTLESRASSALATIPSPHFGASDDLRRRRDQRRPDSQRLLQIAL